MVFSFWSEENAAFRGPYLSCGNRSLLYLESLNVFPCKLILRQKTTPFKWTLIRQQSLYSIFE